MNRQFPYLSDAVAAARHYEERAQCPYYVVRSGMYEIFLVTAKRPDSGEWWDTQGLPHNEMSEA